MNSTHKCEVVKIELQKHPNANSLSFMNVFGGYTVCCRTDDWKGIHKGIYIPPESEVDITRPEFSFLAGMSKNGKTAIIKVKKFRGIQSFGLLIPAPEDAQIGEDFAEKLGVTHYEPEFQVCMGGDNEKPPKELANLSKYDIDTARKYSHLFIPGEAVWVTEKLHGSNSTYSWIDDRIWVKSRTLWKKEDDRSPWWIAYKNTPSIGDFCRDNPGWKVHGEILGIQGKDYSYGFSASKTGFAAFDVSDEYGNFLPPLEFFEICYKYDIPTVPIVANMQWIDLESVATFAEGKSLWPGVDQIREGVVITPSNERWHPDIGRVKLKIVGFGYLEKN